MNRRGVIGIDLGTESVKAVALEVAANEEIKILGTSATLSDGIKRGVIMDIDLAAASLAKAIDNLKKIAEIKNASIYISIGGVGLGFQKSKGLVAISRADGEVSKEDIKRAITTSEANMHRTQNREILHQLPVSYKIDNETVTHDPIGLSGVKLEAETLFITVFSQNLKSLLKALDAADLDAENIAAGPLAVSHAALSKRDKEVGAMILDIGSTTTSIILFEENYPYSLEVFPVGSGHITNDIAVGFQIPLEEAEKLKINYGGVEQEAVHNASKKTSKGADDLVYGNYSKKKLSMIIEARLDDIFELIEKHLKKVGRAGLLPAGIVITGGGANLPGIDEYTKTYLKLPARIAETQNLGGFRDKIKNPAWAGAVGVALMALEEKNSATGVAGVLSRGTSGPFFKWLRAFLP